MTLHEQLKTLNDDFGVVTHTRDKDEFSSGELWDNLVYTCLQRQRHEQVHLSFVIRYDALGVVAYDTVVTTKMITQEQARQYLDLLNQVTEKEEQEDA